MWSFQSPLSFRLMSLAPHLPQKARSLLQLISKFKVFPLHHPLISQLTHCLLLRESSPLPTQQSPFALLLTQSQQQKVRLLSQLRLLFPTSSLLPQRPSSSFLSCSALHVSSWTYQLNSTATVLPWWESHLSPHLPPSPWCIHRCPAHCLSSSWSFLQQLLRINEVSSLHFTWSLFYTLISSSPFGRSPQLHSSCFQSPLGIC